MTRSATESAPVLYAFLGKLPRFLEENIPIEELDVALRRHGIDGHPNEAILIFRDGTEEIRMSYGEYATLFGRPAMSTSGKDIYLSSNMRVWIAGIVGAGLGDDE